MQKCGVIVWDCLATGQITVGELDGETPRTSYKLEKN